MGKLQSKIMMPYTSKTTTNLTEAMQGQVQSNPVTFPKELGEDHPFKFEECEKTYKKFGIAKAAVDKHIDFIVSPGFYVESENEKVQRVINDFIEDIQFHEILRQWIREGLIKGNGFMEIALSKDLSKVQLKVINANSMYVSRDKFGDIKGYNQYVGKFDKFNPKQVIPFDKKEIAHLPMDKIGDDAYGIGLLAPALYTIDNIVGSDRDMHMLIRRKANAPIHVKLGSPEEPATQSDISAFGAKLEYLNNMHEWATDHRAEFKVIDFGNLGEKFTTVMEHDMESLLYAFQIPAVLMGSAYQNEGIAQVQLDAFERRIQSLQAAIGKVIEDQIFKPILTLNGLAGKVEIVWGQPSEQKINQRIQQLGQLLNNAMLNPVVRITLEKEVLTLLGKEKEADELEIPENPEAEREKEQNIKQPEIPGEKPAAKEIAESWGFKESADLTVNEWVNIQEIPGFNYKEYLAFVLDRIHIDEFKDLRAIDEKEIDMGLLSEIDLNKLRRVLRNGFVSNESVNEIAKNIMEKVPLKDRKDAEGNLMLTKEERPIVISRTETVRLSNQGLVDMYKDKDIKKVRWLSSISDRTCPACEQMNGKLFEIGDLSVGDSQPPLHVNCRCALIGVTE